MTSSDNIETVYEGRFLHVVKRGTWEYAVTISRPGTSSKMSASIAHMTPKPALSIPRVSSSGKKSSSVIRRSHTGLSRSPNTSKAQRSPRQGVSPRLLNASTARGPSSPETRLANLMPLGSEVLQVCSMRSSNETRRASCPSGVSSMGWTRDCTRVVADSLRSFFGTTSLPAPVYFVSKKLLSGTSTQSPTSISTL